MISHYDKSMVRLVASFLQQKENAYVTPPVRLFIQMFYLGFASYHKWSFCHRAEIVLKLRKSFYKLK